MNRILIQCLALGLLLAAQQTAPACVPVLSLITEQTADYDESLFDPADEFSDDYAEDEVEYAAPAEVSVSFINTEALEERELLTFCIVPDEGADEIEIMGIVSSAYVAEVETTVISLPPEDYIIYSQYMEPVRFTIDNKDQVFFITVDCKAHDMLIEIY